MSTWVLLSPHWPSCTPQYPGATAGLGAGGRWGGPAPPAPGHPAGHRLSVRWNLEQLPPPRLALLCSLLTRRELPPRARRGTLRWAPGAASAGTHTLASRPRPVLVQVTQPLRLPLTSSALRQALF